MQILGLRTDPAEPELNDGDDGIAVSLGVLLLDEAATALSNQARVAVEICDLSQTPTCVGATQTDVTAGGTITLPLSLTRQAIERADRLDPLQGYGGRHLQIRVTATTLDGRVAKASKILVIGPTGSARNEGFTITGLKVHRPIHVDRNVLLPFEADDQVYAAGEPMTLYTQEEVWIAPVLSPGARETFDVVDLSGHAATLAEQITYSFFAPKTHVDLGAEIAGEPADPIAPNDGINQLKYLHVGGGSGTLWITARDSRGAQTWQDFPFRALDYRQCHTQAGRCPLLEIACQ